MNSTWAPLQWWNMSREQKNCTYEKEMEKVRFKICNHGSARPFSTNKNQLSSKIRGEGTALALPPGLARPGPCEPGFQFFYFQQNYFSLNFSPFFCLSVMKLHWLFICVQEHTLWHISFETLLTKSHLSLHRKEELWEQHSQQHILTKCPLKYQN